MACDVESENENTVVHTVWLSTVYLDTNTLRTKNVRHNFTLLNRNTYGACSERYITVPYYVATVLARVTDGFSKDNVIHKKALPLLPCPTLPASARPIHSNSAFCACR